jgi:putative oxidoreductase
MRFVKLPAFLPRTYNKLVGLSEKLEDVLLIIVRLWIANIFFKSGLVKIEDFDNTLSLFQDEYMVPFVNHYFAAYSATFFELVCSSLIALGLFTRLAALPLLGMTAVIQFTYDMHDDHFYWAVILALLFIRGAGFFSLDRWVGVK